ncbi:MAG TPA: Omp28-related outer membrane protein [Candidatus Marinimicrobia bacterium]|nr:Omp28-related outer membrane protein [Candidatus Neomarinimicrobiota bacterium]
MNKWIILLTLLAFGFAGAAPRKVVLFEQATNASCGPCAASNPRVQQLISQNFGKIVGVRYHAWWPGTDPMYTHNTTDNRSRIQYYGVSGVPTYMIDGSNYGVPGSLDAMTTQMNERLSVPSPVALEAFYHYDPESDTVTVAVSLIAEEALIGENMVLHLALIERMVVFATPPGSNGESEFGDVMRRMYPSGEGLTIGSLDAGTELFYEYKARKHRDWNINDLAAVAFVQNNANKEIINAAISFPTIKVETSDPMVDLLELNNSYVKNYQLPNNYDDTVRVTLFIADLDLPQDWSVSFLENRSDELSLTILPGESAEAAIEIVTGNEAGTVTYKLFAKNEDDPHGYGNSLDYFGFMQSGDVLLVDNDGGANYQLYYTGALNAIHRAYTYVEHGNLKYISDNVRAENFKTVIWHVGWSSPVLTPADVEILTAYLQEGGSLLITGQDIGWDIFNNDGASNFQEAKDFYTNFLDAVYVRDASGINSYTGVPDDIIGDGIAFPLNGIYTKYPDELDSHSALSQPVFYFEGTERIGGLRLDAGFPTFHKAVYLGFSLEQISDPAIRQSIMARSLAFFDSLTLEFITGDINFDGVIEAADAAHILNSRAALENLHPYSAEVANVSADSTISALDAALILQYEAKIITELPYAFDAESYPAATSPLLHYKGFDGEKHIVEMQFNDSQNIFALEGRLEFSPALEYAGALWNGLAESSLASYGFAESAIHFAVAAPEIINLDELSLQVHFKMTEIREDSVSVSLKKLRLNEEASLDDAAHLNFVISSLENPGFPGAFELKALYPNPFNPMTTLTYVLPAVSDLTLQIYNLRGALVESKDWKNHPAGEFSYKWNAAGLPSGIYLIRLSNGHSVKSVKAILLK